MDKIEYRAVIKYWFLKGNMPTQIKDELDSEYGDSAPSFTTVKFWAAEFKRGRKSLGEKSLRKRRVLFARVTEMRASLGEVCRVTKGDYVEK
ncbi:HTH_48 domain-containing protein [Trichonephila clavipes]|nr:HTH_48 domain-containing protein [Trichonephila clavipes]